MTNTDFFADHAAALALDLSKGGIEGEEARTLAEVIERLFDHSAAAVGDLRRSTAEADPLCAGLKLFLSSIDEIEQARETRRGELRETLGASSAGPVPVKGSAKTGAPGRERR